MRVAPVEAWLWILSVCREVGMLPNPVCSIAWLTGEDDLGEPTQLLSLCAKARILGDTGKAIVSGSYCNQRVASDPWILVEQLADVAQFDLQLVRPFLNCCLIR